MAMTVSDLVDKHQSVERSIEASNKAFNAVGKAFKELESALPKEQQPLVEPLRAALFAASERNSIDRQMLRNYASMLLEIMRQTEIDWPPKYVQSH